MRILSNQICSSKRFSPSRQARDTRAREQRLAACNALPRYRNVPVLLGRLIDYGPWRQHPDYSTLERRGGLFVAKCPGCGRVHRHGWRMEDGFDIFSPRGPHCPHDSGSPLLWSGYRIALDPKADHAVLIGHTPLRVRETRQVIQSPVWM